MIHPFYIRYFAILLVLLLICLGLINKATIRLKLKSVFSDFNFIYISFILVFIGYINFDTFSRTNLVTVSLGFSKYFQILMMFTAFLISVTYGYKNNVSISKLFKMPIFLLVIYTYIAMFSSLFLSQAYYLAIYKSMLLMFDLFIIAIIMSLKDDFNNFIKVFNIIKLEFTLLIVFFLLGLVFKPEIALQPNFGILRVQLFGVIPSIHPNTVGFISVIALLFFWSSLTYSQGLKERLLYTNLSLCAFFTLMLAQSRTSMISIGFGIILFEILRGKFKWIIIFSCMALFVYLYLYDTFNQYWLRGSTMEQMSTLSGRTIGWEYAFSRFLDAPFMGYGYAAGIRFGLAWSSRYYQAFLTNMHNSYGEVLLSVGLLGFIPWITAFVYIISKTILNCYRHLRIKQTAIIHHQHSIEIVTILFCCIIRTFTGSLFVYHDFLIFIFLLFIFYSQLSFLKPTNK